MSTVATTTNKTSKVTPPAPVAPVATAESNEVFINQSAIRRMISPLIYFVMNAVNVKDLFLGAGVALDQKTIDYMSTEIKTRAARIIGDLDPEVFAVSLPEMVKAILEKIPNSGGNKAVRSETASLRVEFLKTLRTLNTVTEVEAHAATWPKMPDTVADAVSLRKSIAKRKMDREAAKAAKEATAEAKPSRKKAPAPAPAPIAEVAPKAKRPVVASIA